MSKLDQDSSDDTEKFIRIASGDTTTTVKLIEDFEISTSPNDKSSNKISFTGLSKEEVLKYATDPQWVKIRWIIFAIFWILWFAMLIAAVLLIVFTPKCPYRPKLEWWHNDVFYQIDVAKFKDSNGDGIGDLNGINSKLDYFESLGIKTLLLYNLVDKNQPKKVDPRYGQNDLEDFKKTLKSKNMNLVIDIPIDTLGSTADDLKTKTLETIQHWLKHYVDGVRLTNMEKLKDLNSSLNDTLKSILSGLYEKVEEISKNTLNKKLLLFSSDDYDLNFKFEAYKPNFIINPLFNGSDISQYLKTPENLIKSLNKNRINPNEEKDWLNAMLSWKNNARLGNLKDNLNGLALTISILLRGIPIILYGDELGMESKNYVQGYMKWDKSVSCGFTKNETIAKTLNIDDKCESSVQYNTAHGAGDTITDLFKNLIKLRSKESLFFGKERILDKTNEVFSFVRDAEGFPTYLIATHFNTESKEDHLIDYNSKYNLPLDAVVEFYFSFGHKPNHDFQYNKTVSTDRILLKYGEILILELKNETSKSIIDAFKPH